MPTYNHICCDENCNNEWEDFYSITTEPPTQCPKCNQETAKRVISKGGSKGVVELSGNELTDKIKSDTQQLKKNIYSSEKLYSNVLGEAKYQEIQTSMDRRKREKY